MAASPRIRNALTLFSSPDCVVCHRVRLVLAAKGVSYELVSVDTANPPEDLLDLNPYHSVPTLVDRDLVLYAASVVSEYLDERYPHPPLMPVDPLSRARLRLAMLRVELEWVPHVQSIQTGNKIQAEAGRKRLKELLLGAFFPEFGNEPRRLCSRADRVPAAGAGDCLAEGSQADRRLRPADFPQSRLPAQPDSGRKAAARVACVSEVTPMSSNRPYLLRALYEWIGDNDMTPHLLVDATREGVQVPASTIKDGRVVLNIAARAVAQLDLGNREVRFKARFGGVSQSVVIPLAAILAIYAQETGQGMMLPEDGGTMPDDSSGDSPEPPDDGPKRGGHLRVVK